jgi:hypothetical protein
MSDDEIVQRMVVLRLCAFHFGHADDAACAGLVFDDDRLSQLPRQIVTESPRNAIGLAARRIWHENTNLTRGPRGLRPALPGQRAQCRRRASHERSPCEL